MWIEDVSLIVPCYQSDQSKTVARHTWTMWVAQKAHLSQCAVAIVSKE